ncbi:MAG: DNA polymerase I [Deltaproteobacteria bacterium]|nr:DNA polymerase I [Deltaproteobacteria bacterium]
MTDNGKKSTLYLIDGSNYLYRAFYAIRELSNSKGFPTNALFVFTNMLMKLLRDYDPEYLAVVFDSRGPTFRHEMYEDYKANRKAMPDELSMQVPRVKEIIQAFSLPVIEEEGLEADDIIGALSRTYREKGYKVVIISGDKDMMQLVSDDVLMVDTMKDKTYDVAAVNERFGVGPDKVIDILGLAGDTSDNVPGVPGVGEKTALALIETYGSLEGVLEHTGSIKKAKLRENLETYAKQARMSRELVTIRTDAHIERDEKELYRGEPDRETLRKLFKEFEFMSFLKNLDGGEATAEGISSRVILKTAEFREFLKQLSAVKGFSLYVQLSPQDAIEGDIAGMSFCTEPGSAVYIPGGYGTGDKGDHLSIDTILAGLKPVFENEGIRKEGYDLKSVLISLWKKGISLRGPARDLMVAAYVLNPSKRDFSLEGVCRDYLDRELTPLKDLTGSASKAVSFTTVPIEKAASFACERAGSIEQLSGVLMSQIREGGFEDLFSGVEMPLIPVLASMEEKGVLIDVKLLQEMSEQLGQLMALSEKKIYELAGEEFNINSPKQLQVILFDKLKLPKGRKTKEGYSTDVDVLTFLAQSYELPAEILSYRSFAKLRSTYVDALPTMVNPRTGRIHTSYNQTVTATGRLSSSDPNLQNIPIRTMEGKRIRQAFIVPEGYEILSADYSQIELRILAHLSKDGELIQVFESGEDIHTRTASRIFGVFPELVNSDMRRQAKVINFGIIYGMSPFGLAKELGISQALAKTYIDEYFNRFREVRRYIDEVLEKARRDGFVTTLFGRRRYIPEINGRNATVRQFAERTAINTPIQGTAADIIKVAMVNIWNRMRREGLTSSMIMQVHDELVFEMPLEEKKVLTDLVKVEMEGVITLNVPLLVSIYSGKNWDEAH